MNGIGEDGIDQNYPNPMSGINEGGFNEKNSETQQVERSNSTTGPRFPGDPDFPLQNPPRSSETSMSRTERRNLLSKRASKAPTVISRNAAISRIDLIASAERIFARYLLPGSEKEIYLPSSLRILNFPVNSNGLPDAEDEEQQRALAGIPDMFHNQKE